MKNERIMLYKSNQKRDGSYPVCLRITKNGRRKYINLGLSAMQEQWCQETRRFKRNKQVYPTYDRDNAFLNSCEVRADKLLRAFMEKRIDWTLNQFEDEFCGMSKKGKVYDYFEKQIFKLKETNHIGNANAYARTLQILCKYDKRIREKLFSEIDIKFVNALNEALEKDGCCGNTRKYYLKTLRAVMNKAIKEKEVSLDTYPFGKNGFEISKLEEETEKRYLLSNDLVLVKNSLQPNFVLERARRLFLFSYYCFGMSFIDMAGLTADNIRILEQGEFFVYKRHKTQNSKKVEFIKIPINDTIKELLDWFRQNTLLVGDYLLPIVTREYRGEQLYNHIRTRYKRINNNTKKLGEFLGIRLNLTTYVARHTMAMVLQSKNEPREVISEVLGHKSLSTTNVYLDSFDTEVLNKAANLL